MRRLFEDPELPAGLREDLVRSRDAAHDYPAHAKLAQLQAALSDPTRQPLERGSLWRAVHPGWKLAALLALGGASAFVARPAERAPQPRPQTASTPAQPSAAAPVAPPAPPDAAEPVEPPVPPEGAAPPTPESPAAATAPQSSSSRREIAQLVRIRALLAEDPLAAYRLALRSEREFPRGLLTEERQALAIVALAKSGSRDGAVTKARDFFTRYPHSTMRQLIESALGREPR
jgi:hypothetical protein